MTDNFDFILPVRNELKKDFILGLKGRLPIALILGFSGYRSQVLPLLQSLSHTFRAYICNANGLPGFVFRFDIIKFLKAADEACQLEYAKKWQFIDLNSVLRELEYFDS